MQAKVREGSPGKVKLRGELDLIQVSFKPGVKERGLLAILYMYCKILKLCTLTDYGEY